MTRAADAGSQDAAASSRAAIRAELTAELVTTLAGGQGVALVGPAGIGKSAMASAIVDELFDTHAVLAATGRRSTLDVPMGAFEASLPAEVDSIRAAISLLRQQLTGAGRPGLLHVDDAGELDEASAFIAHALAATPGVRTLMTHRGTATLPPAVAQIRAAGFVREVRLEPLTDDDVQRLARARLDGRLGPSTLDRLCRLVEGNPLFVGELLAAGRQSGALVLQGETWHWTGDWRTGLRLSGVVDEHLRVLDPAHRELLELIAVAEPVSPTALAGHERELDDLERAGLVRSGAVGDVGLVHPLYGEVLRDQLPASRRPDLARRLAALPLPARRDLRLRAVRWRLDAGVDVTTDDLLEAGTSAMRGEDYDTAIDLARRAIDAGTRTRGGYLLGISLDDAGRYPESQAALEEAWRHDDGGDDAILLVGLARAELVLNFGPDPDLALDHLAALRERCPAAGERITAEEVLVLLLAGRPAEALARIEPLPDTPDERLASMALPAVLALAVTGRGTEAVAFAERGMAAREGLGEPVGMARAAVFGVAAVFALETCGRLVDAATAAAVGHARALELEEAVGQAWFALNLGNTTLAAGEAAEAEAWAGEAAATFASSGRPAARWAWAGAAMAAVAAGAPERAGSHLERIDQAGPTCWRFLDPLIDRADAWRRWSAGDTDAALDRLREGVDAAVAGAMPWLEGVLRIDLARFGDGPAQVARLTELARKASDPRPGLWATALAAINDHEEGAITQVADELVTLGAATEAADVLALAASRRWATEPAAATDLARRARDALSGRAISSPALQGLAAVPGLPARVVEVARLASAGASSRQIADALVVSVRTVDNQLGRAFKALHVTSRQELAPVVAAWFGP